MKSINSFSALLGLAMAHNVQAARFANMTGDAGTGVTLYTGQDDPSISIDGSVKNFSQEGYIGKEFTLTLKNTAVATRTARLFAGYNTGDNAALPGQIVDGDFNDVNGNPGLTAASNSPSATIREFQRFCERNPTRIVHLRIQSDSDAQVQQVFSLRQLNPFNTQGSIQVKPGLTVTGAQYNPKIADVPCDFQIDDKSDMTLNVLAGSTTTYTFFCGATLSNGRELAVKAAVAKTNLALM